MPKSKLASKNNKKIYIRIAVGAIVTLALLGILYMFSIFQIPQHSYYYVKCGLSRPVLVVSRGFSGDTLNYVSPRNPSYKDYRFTTVGYFCTEAETQQAGLKNIEKDGWYNPESTPRNQVIW